MNLSTYLQYRSELEYEMSKAVEQVNKYRESVGVAPIPVAVFEKLVHKRAKETSMSILRSIEFEVRRQKALFGGIS